MTVDELIAELEDMRANGRGGQKVFLFRQGDQVCMPVECVTGHHKAEAELGHVVIGHRSLNADHPWALLATTRVELEGCFDEGEQHDLELLKDLVSEGVAIGFMNYLLVMFRKYDEDKITKTAKRLASNLSARRLNTTWEAM